MRAHEGLDVELLSLDAFPDPLHTVARAMGAPHVDLPAEASRDALGFDLHGNIEGTWGHFVNSIGPGRSEMFVTVPNCLRLV